MIRSMTGFGKGEETGKFGRFTVEVRTVNHRYFDISSRIPNSLNELEGKVKNSIHKYITRGKVNLSLLHKKSEKESSAVKIDNEAVEKYYRMLNKIRKKFSIKENISLSHLLSFPDVIREEQPEYDPNLMWPILERAIRKAVLDCNKMREREGKQLCKDLTARINEIAGFIDRINTLAPQLVSQYKSKLDSRLKHILKNRNYEIDKQRLSTELAMFARQCDVSEEIIRAKSHIKALRTGLLSNKEIGRKLDFILQELQREINTLGSKAGSVKISKLVVDIKSEIEKIREQVQNIE